MFKKTFQNSHINWSLCSFLSLINEVQNIQRMLFIQNKNKLQLTEFKAMKLTVVTLLVHSLMSNINQSIYSCEMIRVSLRSVKHRVVIRASLRSIKYPDTTGNVTNTNIDKYGCLSLLEIRFLLLV